MKNKITFKLFVFFLLVNISSVCVLMVVSRHFATWNFDQYFHFMNMQKLSELADMLSVEYEKQGGWSFLQQPNIWPSLLRESWIIEDTNVIFTSETIAPLRVDKFAKALSDIETDKVRSYWFENISLYSCERELLAGKNLSLDELELIPVVVKNQNIGVLGIKMNSINFHPTVQKLIKKQSLLFNFVGGLMIISLTVVIFIFSSRYLISPIHNLSVAMKTLTDRNFDVRIPVKNKDELGTLAIHFNAMAKQFQEYDQNQKQWLMDISHELRTPLSAMICEIEVWKNGMEKPSNKLIHSLSHEIRHIIKLVNDLHDISLIETAPPSMDKKLVKPLPLLSQGLYIFQKRLEKNNMSLEVLFEKENVDLQILGDATLLQQLFINIIENAIRYTKHPGKLIIRQAREDNYIKLAFEDSGPGVPEHALPHLFNRLYRVEPSRNRKTGGSGLGLAICKSIVERHNGEIRAQNIQEGGFMIEISLPIENNSRSTS